MSGKNTLDEYYNVMNNTIGTLNPSYGEYHSGSGTTTITISGTYYKASGTTTAGSYNNNFSHSNNRLTYTGPTKLFHVSMNGTFTAGNNDSVGVGFAKNGSMYTQSISTAIIGNVTTGTLLHCTDIIQLSSGDYIEAWTSNLSRTISVVHDTMSMTLFSIN